MTKIIIGIVVVVVIVLGAFLILNKGKPPIDIALFDKDEAELSAFNNDVTLFDQDNTVLDELNQTFSDILEESPAGVSTESALDLASLEQEASEADFSGDLNIFNESVLQELDQAFGEILQ